MQFRQELQILLRLRYLFTNVVTYEEERIGYIINTLNFGFFWSMYNVGTLLMVFRLVLN